MRYTQVESGIFLRRPNRFIAHCLISGKEEVCHVKNTGRCRELLTPGCTVYLEFSANPSRKTRYSLIAVEKAGRLINIDAQAPNAVFYEALCKGFCPDFAPTIAEIRREVPCGQSRLDFCLTTADGPCYVEVKGVTLETNGVVRFPDAPTERGCRHVRELCAMAKKGVQAAVVFIVQMEQVSYFTANWEMDPLFADALLQAQAAGVAVQAYRCKVRPDALELSETVPVRL